MHIGKDEQKHKTETKRKRTGIYIAAAVYINMCDVLDITGKFPKLNTPLARITHRDTFVNRSSTKR